MANGTNDPFDSIGGLPWPPLAGPDQLYDHGAWWCTRAEDHPQRNHDYPDSRHYPHDECRSTAFGVEGRALDDTRYPVDLEVYAMRPFRFGQPRTLPPAEIRIAVDSFDRRYPGTNRLTLSLGDALRVADGLRRQVALVDARGWRAALLAS